MDAEITEATERLQDDTTTENQEQPTSIEGDIVTPVQPADPTEGAQ